MTAASRSVEKLDRAQPDVDLALARRMLSYLRPYLLVAGAALATMLAFALLDTFTVNLLKRALDQALAPVGAFRAESPETRYGHLQAIAVLYALVAAGAFGLRYGQAYLLAMLGQGIVRDIRRDLYRKFIALPLAYFDRNPVGRLMTRVTSDVDAVNQFLTQGLVGLAQDVFLLAIFGGAMFLYDTPLTLAGLTVLIPLWLVTRWLRSRMREAFRSTRLHQALVNIYLNESITGMTTVQLFGREGRARAEFAQRNQRFLRANLDSVRWYSIFYPFVTFMGDIGLAVVLFVGGLEHLRGGLSIGTVVAMVELLRRMFAPLQDIADKFNVLQAAFASAERIYGVLDEPETVSDAPDARPVTTLRGEVELRHVWFAYQDPPAGAPDDAWVLRDVNLKISPGESLALVGATGAGKSSIISLVSRFYDVQRGAVLVDGLDVRGYAQRSLRRHIGVVLQDVFLFSGSVFDNLTLFDPATTREQALRAARFTGADEFIARLPKGYDTLLMERGSGLSTGQKQLLAFTRAILQNPDIVLVLDEATANVDSESEAKIQAALARVMHGRTSIIIAHRLATIERCDRIIVIADGRVVEEGTHAKLLARGGHYARLHGAQAQTT